VPLFTDDPGSSFYDFLVSRRPDFPMLSQPAKPGSLAPPTPAAAGSSSSSALPPLSHGTTVLAIRFQGGVLIAGDRQATEGFQVSGRRIEKVFTTDAHSAVAIAGVAGPAMELARLFQIELEHYEKLEGDILSCEGKANKLAQMVRGNLPMAMQGLVVIPLFAGYDLKRREGRIFKYDVTGGRYEETEYHAVGSGGKDARDTMKQMYRRDLPEADTLRIALEALYNAAEEDLGTGGPDVLRGIYPTVKVITEQGVRDLEASRIASACTTLIETRRDRS
jgi:proteasome beta subunit